MEHDFLLHFVTEEIKDISDQDIFLDEVFEEENYTEYVLTSNFESATKFAQTLREFFNYNIYLKIKS
ncbi:MAG: hypothetical protein OXU73_00105 [Candidatus Campbellbacteria bacterium]|nr:hypothetical protein [Candidatus Campbellbacteria bacterium]